MAIHGSSAYFNLDTAGGSPTDLTAYAREVDLTLENAMHDITVFGMSSHAKTTGLKDGKFTVTFVSSNTIMDHLTAIFAAQTPGGATTFTFVIGPRGSTSGYEKITGECLMPSMPISAKVDDIETLQVTFECTGAVSITTF